MKIEHKILLTSAIAGSLALAPIAFAENTSAPTTPTSPSPTNKMVGQKNDGKMMKKEEHPMTKNVPTAEMKKMMDKKMKEKSDKTEISGVMADYMKERKALEADFHAKMKALDEKYKDKLPKRSEKTIKDSTNTTDQTHG